MPDINGKLSRAEKRDVIDRLTAFDKERGSDLACEVCGTDHWYVNDYMVQVPSDTPRGAMASRMRTPLIATYCGQCGNMKFFAAKILGVEPAETEEDAKEETSDGD